MLSALWSHKLCLIGLGELEPLLSYQPTSLQSPATLAMASHCRWNSSFPYHRKTRRHSPRTCSQLTSQKRDKWSSKSAPAYSCSLMERCLAKIRLHRRCLWQPCRYCLVYRFLRGQLVAFLARQKARKLQTTNNTKSLHRKRANRTPCPKVKHKC
eukprot:SAG31_NODE_258_length_18937_cov_61.688555_6_plen_155_part_00